MAIIIGMCAVCVAIGMITWNVIIMEKRRRRGDVGVEAGGLEGECPTDGAHSSESPSLELPSSPQHAISSTSPIAEVSEAPWYHELVVVIGGPDLPPVPRGLPEVPEHQDGNTRSRAFADMGIISTDSLSPPSEVCDLSQGFYLTQPWSPPSRHDRHKRSCSVTIGNRPRLYSEYTPAPASMYGSGDGDEGGMPGGRLGRVTRANSTPAVMDGMRVRVDALNSLECEWDEDDEGVCTDGDNDDGDGSNFSDDSKMDKSIQGGDNAEDGNGDKDITPHGGADIMWTEYPSTEASEPESDAMQETEAYTSMGMSSTSTDINTDTRVVELPRDLLEDIPWVRDKSGSRNQFGSAGRRQERGRAMRKSSGEVLGSPRPIYTQPGRVLPVS